MYWVVDDCCSTSDEIMLSTMWFDITAMKQVRTEHVGNCEVLGVRSFMNAKCCFVCNVFIR